MCCPYLGCRESRLQCLNEEQVVEYEEVYEEVPNKGKTSAGPSQASTLILLKVMARR